MGGYDLHGRYYPNINDAYNAEMAQCAEIDARLAYEKADRLERQMYEQQQNQDYELHQKVDYLMSKVESLEKEIETLKGRKED